MPPFPLVAFQRQPYLEVRQNVASGVEVVLSITRAYTTYTTTIGLSPSTAAASSPSDPTTAPLPQAPTPQATSPNPPNTGVVVGAILGSILGAGVLIVLIYRCCFENRSALYTGSSYYDSDSDSGGSSRSSRIHTRGGYLPHHHHHHGGVRSPRRARTRRHHGMSERSESRSEAGWSTRGRRKRNSGMVMHNGVLGWRLAPKTRNHDRFERRWPRDRRDEKLADD